MPEVAASVDQRLIDEHTYGVKPPSPPPGSTAAPGSIADYDIVICVSEDAINRQLQLLYEHSFISDNLPPPTNLDGTRNLLTAEHLVSHELEAPTNEDSGNGTRLGLFAHVECPRIDISSNQGNDSQSLKMSVKFKRDDEATTPDSVFRYMVNGSISEKNMNGFEVSFLATIKKEDISNASSQLIGPSRDGGNDAKLHPKLEDALDQRSDLNFSSIYCFFESDKMRNTFNLKDGDSDVIDDGFKGPLIDCVVNYFTGLHTNTNPGLSTPGNPYVLGYGMSYKPDQTPKDPNTPAYFVPKSFDITLTPGKDSYKGTLNYCITTYRAQGDPNINQGPKPGILDQNYLAANQSSNYDGIVGISQGIFFSRHVVRTIGPMLWVNPDAMLGYPGEGFQFSQVNIQPDYGTSWISNSHFVTNYASADAGAVCEGRRRITGENNLGLTFTSDLVQSSVPMSSDSRRQARVEIYIRTYVSTHFETRGTIGGAYQDVERGVTGVIGGIFGAPPPPDTSWSEQATAFLNLNFKITLELSADTDGRMHVDSKYENGQPTFDSDGKLQITQISANSGGDPNNYGAFMCYDDRSSSWDSLWGSRANIGSMTDQMSKIGTNTVRNITNILQNWQNGFGSTVIMPAGDSFSFRGMNTDQYGNLFSQITYDHEEMNN